MQVSFVGEWAVDTGGPRREFFRLVALEAKEKFFIGRSFQKFFLCDILAIQVSLLYYLKFYLCYNYRGMIITILGVSWQCQLSRVVMECHFCIMLSTSILSMERKQIF